MKVLITGGAGYIGMALTYKLLQNESITEVVVYDSLVTGRSNILFDSTLQTKRFRFIQGELLDTRSLQELIDEVEIVYHLAARVVMPLSNFGAHQFGQVNVWGTAELSYLIEASTSVKKVIYLSSSTVYGFTENPKTEKEQAIPISFYAKSKLLSEGYLERLKNKKEVVILRCGNVFGYCPSMRLDSIINDLVYDILFKKKVSVEGDGTQMYSFVSIDGITEILDKALSVDIGEASVIQNAVIWNLSIKSVLNAMREFVPDFEVVYITRNVIQQHIMGAINHDLNDLIDDKYKDFDGELKKLVQSFSKEI